MLTTNEREYLLSSMENLLMDYDYDYEINSLTAIIDEWARQKAGLIEAFKKHPNYIEGKFMIAFDADYERSIDRIASRNFSSWLQLHVMYQYKDRLPEEIQARKYESQYLPQDIFDFFDYLHNYAERCISESTAAYLNNCVPEIHAHVGQKTSRVVNKLCCYLGYDKADGYNREFAKYADSLSPLTIKRHTVLSINPLDYLTMSFGNSWASCHTIDKENKRNMPNNYSGCYSSGTISYMLDPSSMVLYTVDASYDGNEYWNQPKINRQMFHWGEEKLIQGRLYPQDNDGDDSVYTPYRNIVQSIVSTMFGFPNLWTLNKGTDHARRYICSYGTHYRDYEYYRNCSLSRVKGSENNEYITVGAIPICIECGNRHTEADNINCCHNRHYTCADCGARVDEEDIIWIDDVAYCRYCVRYCDSCMEYHHREETYVNGVGYVCDACMEYYVYCDCCDEYVHQDDAWWVESEGIYVCCHCRDNHYTECDCCGELIRDENVFTFENEMLCEDCYNDRNEEDGEAC